MIAIFVNNFANADYTLSVPIRWCAGLICSFSPCTRSLPAPSIPVMAVQTILLLGNPLLYQMCAEILPDELSQLPPLVADLHDTLMDFRARYAAGRAIAAPQIGVLKRLIYMHVGSPVVFINPVLHDLSEEILEIWDDCMSFPDLLVRVRRHRSCRITYRDLEWNEQTLILEDALSELLQHEVDHLDGILAVKRAIDSESFAYRSERERLL